MLSSQELRLRRRQRQRTKIRQVGNGRARLCIHRTNQHIYAQVIDDLTSNTVASASTVSKDAKAKLKSGSTKDAAIYVGKVVAEAAVKNGVKEVVFDRSGFLFHGRVKALADSARENGLVF
jgi:large subunit ribosomal protein L18